MERCARILVLIACAGVAAGAIPLPAAAKLYETRQAALVRVFGPTAHCEPRTVYLTPTELEATRKLARARVESPRFTAWVATQGDTLLGVAFLDVAVVRTMPATWFIAIDPQGRLLAVDVLAFQEPEDYLPSRRWLDRLLGRTLSPKLRPGADVDGISGATLSARAVTDAARRCLALATRVVPAANGPGSAAPERFGAHP